MTTPATTGLREWLREMSREAEAAAKGARTNAEAQWHLGQQHMADAVLTRLATDTVVERNDSPRGIDMTKVANDAFEAGRAWEREHSATTPVAVVSSSLDVERLIRAAISDGYYEARNDGQTMEYAASDATRRVLEVLEGYGIRLAHNADTDTGARRPRFDMDQDDSQEPPWTDTGGTGR